MPFPVRNNSKSVLFWESRRNLNGGLSTAITISLCKRMPFCALRWEGTDFGEGHDSGRARLQPCRRSALSLLSFRGTLVPRNLLLLVRQAPSKSNPNGRRETRAASPDDPHNPSVGPPSLFLQNTTPSSGQRKKVFSLDIPFIEPLGLTWFGTLQL